ncbi:ABC transporter ATP-binding protein [Halobaculum marinum]|uniref:ABC transporter ATP-binding protein n=1 Tax=Halobaculum marinum TaxID=3031996 RepID=A0ABD5WXA8_9EURY|nr:ABC transporter ATP-binding protein [Halobaculum sp. DT55]
MSDSVVSLSDVSIAFGDVTIVKELTLSIDAGEFVALVGPNGSGKTTLLELLAGLRTPDEGSVSRPDVDRDAAYLPQTPAFRHGFTAAETLAFYARLADAADEPQTYLDRVGLTAAGDRPVEALSGGMTRLLGLAQALVGDPPLVVLDEPTSGLDPEMADHVFAAMADIVAGDRALVVASHDLVAVERVADRVIVLGGGAVRLDGPPDALVAQSEAASLREVLSTVVAETEPQRLAVADGEGGR